MALMKNGEPYKMLTKIEEVEFVDVSDMAGIERVADFHEKYIDRLPEHLRITNMQSVLELWLREYEKLRLGTSSRPESALHIKAGPQI